MPFCISCGAENPEGAKFCAKCGAKQEIEAAPPSEAAGKPADLPMPAPPPPAAAPEAPTPVIPQPAAPITLEPKPTPQAVPETETETETEPAPEPAPVTAKEALKPPQVKPQQGSAKEPIPGAPGQTQFFMAAAQVSRFCRTGRACHAAR